MRSYTEAEQPFPSLPNKKLCLQTLFLSLQGSCPNLLWEDLKNKSNKIKNTSCVKLKHIRSLNVPSFTSSQLLNRDAFKASLSFHLFGRAAALPETLLLPPLAKKEMPGRELAWQQGPESVRLVWESMFINPKALFRARCLRDSALFSSQLY